MLYYLVKRRYAHTLQSWIEHYQELLLGRVRILPYEECHGSLPAGTFIFSDLERLSAESTRRASKLWRKLRRAGCRILNHPSESLRRYELQKALHNDFRVFRRHEVPDDLRFPAFLRRENDHKGSLTPLLHDEHGYRAAREEFPDALLVEYLDTRDDAGLFRKYSATRIGDHIVPRHILFSRQWVVKSAGVVTPETTREELDYAESNPHRDELLEIFRLAKIEYGRVDYSFYEGRIQSWEINTNPTLVSQAGAKPSEHPEERAEVYRLSAEGINRALLELAAEPVRGRVRLGFPRTLRPESRFTI